LPIDCRQPLFSMPLMMPFIFLSPARFSMADDSHFDIFIAFSDITLIATPAD
jgi:hypothetical protein